MRAHALLERMCSSGRSTWFGIFGFTLAIFLVTCHLWAGQNMDGQAAAWPAWQLIHHGTFDLSNAPGLPTDNPWIAVRGDRTVSNRFAGVVLIAVPLNALLSFSGLNAEQVGALTAALLTAAAIANMALLLRGLVDRRLALAAATLLAFGTPMWTVASAELWTHGPDAFYLTLGLLLISRERYLLAGIALSPLVLTRPHLTVVIAVLGLWESWTRRSMRPCLSLGIPAGFAVLALLLWNHWMFGAGTIGGAYIGVVSSATRSPWDGAEQFGVNIIGTLFSGWCGALLYTPVLLVLLGALPAGWRASPPWARASVIGGLTYQVIQLRVYIYNGGGAFYGNRLIIELLVLATPMLTVGYARWSEGRPKRVVLTAILAAASVGIFATGAVLHDYWRGGDFSDWTTWYPTVVVRAAGPSGVLMVLCVAMGVALAGTVSYQSQATASARAGARAGR